MIKSWYLHVREETMAPARMVSFMEKHIATCEICLQDPEVKEEVAKITEMVLPESKIPKAVRQQNASDEDEEIVEEEDDEQDTSDSDYDDDDEEEEEDFDINEDDDLK
ncbi:MAG: hypothetical protein ACWGOX_12960 [Desulforhopalus sp.]